MAAVAPGIVTAEVIVAGRAAAGGATEIVSATVTRVVFAPATASVAGIVAALRPAPIRGTPV